MSGEEEECVLALVLHVLDVLELAHVGHTRGEQRVETRRDHVEERALALVQLVEVHV